MLRNKEIQRFLLAFCAVSVVFVTAGYHIQPAAGALLLAFSVVSGALFWGFTKARYNSIAALSEQIDRVLHRADSLYINESAEGELAILQSEITKMTLRIREQNDALKSEKAHLADSLADIAHQLRTPLTSVSLILSLLEQETEEAERKSLLREAEELFAQMDWLLRSLLKLSRLDAGIVEFQRNPIDVAALIRHVLRPLLIPMELHNVTYTVSVPQDATIVGDADWLCEALQNVIKNCMESIGDNGHIEIACNDTVLFTEITIHDSGAGFDKDELPRLFDRFYRGKKDTAAGYGIGLALCKTIITRQGGTIAAKNHPHGGALFTVRFSK